ncbi:phosphoenolpyruvate carboxykinase (GTP) [Enemella dayhoffiae]|uniref:Phosphoenolpyruvate carboxykinase [GTP] n=1 Tax=Enemella dayhoffiae TaxID=2016507 RepID=A0A255HBJ1_9ACTN|nr:phosphoenolpyruvate carboxykinase (GTP) [Enemella dayhoffiae]OYO24979.1 phosphoenolpyruvate carboxykinase (GTP) [Enemella dayhoffiae]
MTAIVGQNAPTKHSELLAWVEEVAALTKPDAVRWCDGSDAEWKEFTDLLVDRGVATRLNDEAKPNSFYFRSDPTDVARVEDQTFICTETEDGAGPTNNWSDPAEMKQTMGKLYDGCMKGRTMFVVPFCMGPIDADDPKFGVELTDSEYVVISMKIMTRMGKDALAAMGTDKPFVKCLHSVGHPIADGEQDVAWPCNDTKYISHFPETREIWSYGSGYGGNALLGKKCYALRIASAMAHDEGWLAEHMLILELTSPENKKYVVCAAFPSACGKTNLAMLEPTIPGWTVKTLGDDIAWMRFGEDGRLYAVNPENGFFGVAPGTGYHTNPNAMRTIEKGNSIFTNVALTDHGDVWWEEMTSTKPKHLTDWHGKSWTPDNGEKAAHPNSRFTTPIDQCPILSEDFNNPKGVPVDAILFGGRRASTIPLVAQSRDWNHGAFMGATCSSETTAAATGAVGVVRRDPMAMLPFIGYNANDYLQHWVNIGEKGGDKLPAIFFVNWFRKSDQGKFLWPGFGENSRVLEWVINRLEGKAEAVDTPAGAIPAEGSLNVDGLSLTEEDLAAATRFNAEEWKQEVPLIEEWFDKLGDVPQALRDELDTLKQNLS